MTISETITANIDIYRTARLFFHQFGDAALLEAMNREEMLAAIGDQSGAKTWHKIANAIEWMQLNTISNENDTWH